MDALLYLTLRKTKNSLLQLLKPKYLIYFIFYIAVVILPLWYQSEGVYFEVSQELFLIICWFLYSLLSSALIINAIISGVTKFERSDIDYLVNSPINRNQIFLYGFYQKYKIIIRSLIITFVFAYISLKNTTAIKLSAYLKAILILLWLLFVVLFVVVQILVDIKKHNKTKTILWVLAIVYVVVTLIVPAIDLLTPFGFNSWKSYIPLGGWAISILENLLSSNMLSQIISYFIVILSSLIGVYLLNKKDFSYLYNHFLEPEESLQRKPINNRKSKKVFGWGVTTIIGKNHLESFRKDKIPYLDVGTIIFSIFIIIIGIGLTQTYDDQGNLLPSVVVLLVSLLILALVGVLGYNADLIKKELNSIYIHIMPTSTFKKNVSITIIPVVRHFVVALVSIIVISIFAKASASLIINVSLFYLSVTFLLVAVDILFNRFFGNDINEKFELWIYIKYVVGLIAMAPAILILIIGLNLFTGYFYPFLMAALVNMLIYLIICFWCKPTVI